MADLSPLRASLTEATNNPTCTDTPGWTTTSVFDDGSVTCASFQVGCTIPEQKENCCKCKKECCDQCGGDRSPISICGLATLPPALAPGPSPTRPPSADTVCSCSRRTRNYRGRYINEQYYKSCPRELVPNWPEDCDACCGHVSNKMWGFLAFLLVLVPIIWCVYSKRRRGTDETPAAPAYPVVDAAPEPAIAHPVTPAYIPVAGQEPGTYVYNPATASEPEIHVDQGARAPLLANKGVYHEHFRALLAK